MLPLQGQIFPKLAIREAPGRFKSSMASLYPWWIHRNHVISGPWGPVQTSRLSTISTDSVRCTEAQVSFDFRPSIQERGILNEHDTGRAPIPDRIIMFPVDSQHLLGYFCSSFSVLRVGIRS